MNRKLIEIFAVICIIGGAFFPIILRCLEGGWTTEYAVLANAGDWLGGTSAPFFSVAVSLLMYGAYRMQKEELRLTRDEMQQTRKEFETQNLTLKRQEFETTFFHLLELHHQIVNSIFYQRSDNDSYRGRQFISWVYIKMKHSYQEERVPYDMFPSMHKLSPQQVDVKCLNEILRNIFPEIEVNLGHYFKNIFQTLRVLEKSILSPEERMDFAKLLVAQLSNDELNLLFYHCIYNVENKELRELAFRYEIFNTLNPNTLLKEEHYIWFDKD